MAGTPGTLTGLQITKNVLPLFYAHKDPRWISTLIAPISKTNKKSGYIVKMEDGYLRPVNGIVASTAPAAPIDDGYSTIEYNVARRRWSFTIADEDLEDWELPVQAAQRAMRALNAQVAVDREISLSAWMTALSTTPTNFTHYGSPSVKWDATSGTIKVDEDMEGGFEAIENEIGIRPNTIIASPGSHTAIKTWIKGYLAGSGRTKMPGEQDIRDYFEVENYWVGRSRYRSERKGATRALTQCWGTDFVWIGNCSAEKDEPMFATTVVRGEDTKFKPIREENPEATTYVLSSDYQVKVVEEKSMYCLYDCLT